MHGTAQNVVASLAGGQVLLIRCDDMQYVGKQLHHPVKEYNQ